MSVLSVTNPTLADWVKRLDPNGQIAAVAELLAQTNEILDDAVMLESNQPLGHRVTIRTGLPTVYWRSLNTGVPSSKSTTAQVDERIGLLEARSVVDIEVAKLNGNTPAFRLSEDRPFLEAMNQEMASTIFYGNPSTNADEFLGLGARYSALSGFNSSENVLDGGGSGNTAQTSVWLIVWGSETVFCPFPKGQEAGLQHRDLGEQTVQTTAGSSDLSGTLMQAYSSLFTWKHGLVVKDWRYAVRICNLLAADLRTIANTQVHTSTSNLLHQMLMAIYQIPSIGLGRPAFYCNRLVHSALSRIALEKSSGVLTIETAANQFGSPRKFLSFMGIPIRKCDALINTEDEVL